MKFTAFLDTGAIFALADTDGRRHGEVRAIYFDPERRFLLHEWILAAAFSLLTKRLHKQAALRMVGALRSPPKVELATVEQDLRDGGWKRCRLSAEEERDWVDCVSFELVEHRGVHGAHPLDRHFAQAGCTMLAP